MTDYVVFTFTLIIIGIFEVKKLIKENRKKETALYITISLIAFTAGYFYMQNPYAKSFSEIMLEIFGNALRR